MYEFCMNMSDDLLDLFDLYSGFITTIKFISHILTQAYDQFVLSQSFYTSWYVVEKNPFYWNIFEMTAHENIQLN